MLVVLDVLLMIIDERTFVSQVAKRYSSKDEVTHGYCYVSVIYIIALCLIIAFPS